MDPQIYYLSNYGAQAIATPICSQTALEGSDNGDVYEEKKKTIPSYYLRKLNRH